jgi:hypothetical protein
MGSNPRRYHRRREFLARYLALCCAVCSLALVGAGVPAFADGSPPVDPTPITQTPPDNPGNPTQAALLQAQATGQPVSVGSLTTQTSTTVANPDGTLTATTYTQPVRVQQDGSWTPVDATLGLQPDGTYSPAATPSGVDLSGGGGGPLVTLTDPAGQSLSLTMPFSLPAPTVSGGTALYADVLPGVDLEAMVTDQGGFSDSLIIHNSEAAANPALASLTLATSTDGLTVQDDADGGLTAVDSDGTTEFTVPDALMWDSSDTTTAAAGTPQLQRLAASAMPDDGGTPEGDPATSSPAGPGVDARVAPVDMTVGTGSLTLTPDPDMLSSSATTWPVYVDPTVATSHTGHYTETQEGCPDATNYDTPQTNGEGAGYQQYSSTCFGLEESFYQMDISGLSSAMDISHAQLNLTETYGADAGCDNTWPVTVKATGGISSSTDWSHRPTPTTGTEAFSTSVSLKSANISAGCGDRSAGIDVTNPISAKASSDSNTWTFGLYGDETESSTNYGFMRFATNPYITTTYDIPPDVPTALGTTPDSQNTPGSDPSSPDCSATGAGFIGQTTPYSDGTSGITLDAKLTSNISGETVKGDFSFWDDQLDDGSGNPTTLTNPSTSYVTSGTTVHAHVGVAVQDGHEYGWEVKAYDGTDYSPESAICHFTVDLSPPSQAVISPSSSFPPVGSPNSATGKLGDPLTVSVSSQDPVPTGCTRGSCVASGVWHFAYSLDQPIPTNGATTVAATTTNGVATGSVTVTPNTWGTHALYVAAVDKAGNTMPLPTAYTFYVPWNPQTASRTATSTATEFPTCWAPHPPVTSR